MSTWNDVARAWLALPGATEATSASGRRRWLVRGRTFLRERPLHRAGAKAALLADEPAVYFTTSHVDGTLMLMCRLDALDPESLAELAGEAWAGRAPPGWCPATARPESRRTEMATWDDVSRACSALPEVVELTSRQGHRQWRVRDKMFVWERPLRKGDIAELGDSTPTGPVLGARVPDEGAKRALVADEPETYFTTSHFDGYPAVLCRLDRLDEESLRELAEEAWACRAPKRLLAEHRATPD